MIDVASMGGVQRVQQRIADLQERFGIPGGVPGLDFGKMLEREVEKARASDNKAGKAQEVNAASKGEIAAQAAVQEARLTDYVHGASANEFVFADAELHQLVQAAAEKYNVDPKLISAVVEAESGGNQEEISDAGAIGVMQLMPDTAASLGVNPYDEAQNVEGGTKYLRQMLDTFGGDVRKAVAAYNAGPQAVKDYGGVPPYSETQAYVDRVLDMYQ